MRRCTYSCPFCTSVTYSTCAAGSSPPSSRKQTVLASSTSWSGTSVSGLQSPPTGWQSLAVSGPQPAPRGAPFEPPPINGGGAFGSEPPKTGTAPSGIVSVIVGPSPSPPPAGSLPLPLPLSSLLPPHADSEITPVRDKAPNT